MRNGNSTNRKEKGMALTVLQREAVRIEECENDNHALCNPGNCRVSHNWEFFIPEDADDYESELALDDDADRYDY
jgi:hypothetical protein